MQDMICRICHGTDKRGTTPILKDEVVEKKLPRVTEVSVLGMLWARLKLQLADKSSVDGEEFIVPCACSGTMRHVHRVCLDVWRRRSPRKDSFHRCEQCHQDYDFQTPWWGRLLAHPLFLFASSLLVYAMVLAMFFTLSHAILAILEPIGAHNGYEIVEIRARPLENGNFDYIEWYSANNAVGTVTTTTFYALEENEPEPEEEETWWSIHLSAFATFLFIVCIFDFVVMNVSWLGVFLLAMGMIRLHYFHSVLFDQIMLVALGTIALIRVWLYVRDQTSHSISRFVRTRLSRVQDRRK